MWRKIISRNSAVLFIILLIAVLLRFSNLNWDNNTHIHPDERFLTMVNGAMKLPKDLFEYLDQQKSLFNPANINFKFYVYGVFPLVLNKLIALKINNDNYNLLTVQGRYLSAFFDLLIVGLVFLIVKLLEKKLGYSKTIKYWASFFYAVAVMPIQLSHFFAVDTFLTFFMLVSLYFSLKLSDGKSLNLVFSGLTFGLALACKANAVFILPLILFALIASILERHKKINKDGLTELLFIILSFGLISYIALRFANPYYFETNDWFDLRISKLFMENLKTLKSWEGKDIWFPPAIQWINKKPVIFSLMNFAVFGVGIPYFLLIIVGMLKIFNPSSKLRTSGNQVSRFTLHVLALWVVGFFLYQSTQFVKAMRYFIFIYPFMAIFAAFGMNEFLLIIKRYSKKTVLSYVFYVLSVVLVLVWPLMFSSIYFHKHTRVEASEWIYDNLPNNSFILAEYWDDALPLSVGNNNGKTFRVEYLPVFDQDTPEKWERMNDLLTMADYYILSSNRGWGSILSVPEKYPQMSQFYNDLLNSDCQLPQPDRLRKGWPDNLCYRKTKEFKPFYYRFFELPNQWADESFTVYDHPKVLIYERIK